MFSQLDEAFGSLEFEDSGLARITAMAHEADGLRLQIHVEFGADGVDAQTWELACRQVLKFQLHDSPIDAVEFVTTHPLLVPSVARWVSLHFVGVPSSPSAIVGELWEAHKEATQGWFGFDEFLNRNLRITDLLASGSGMLGGGPRPFLECYAAVLERHGVRASLIAERDPLEWRQGWHPAKGDLQALVL